LAETTALAFASPLFVTLVSAIALRERVDRARWTIVATGFAGVLLVMRPGSPAFQAAALLPLLGACLWAIGVGFSRKSISHDSVATTTAYSCVVGLAVLSVIVIPGFVVPTLRDLVALTLMSASWSIGHWLNLSAFHLAEAWLLAPFAYSQPFWATPLGYVVFAYVPDGRSFLGICIIVGSGVVAAIRSRHPVAVRRAERSVTRARCAITARQPEPNDQ
jgi:drug/metabolite transporter (DMT)-like permease